MSHGAELQLTGHQRLCQQALTESANTEMPILEGAC
jgi:hypothetical protein